MLHTTVESDNVAEIGWMDENLFVRFKKTSQVYIYFGASQGEYHTLLNAKSIGSHIHKSIKLKFPYASVGIYPTLTAYFSEIASLHPLNEG